MSNNDDFLALTPDGVPDWLVNEVRKAKGTNLSGFRNLDNFYAATDSYKLDRFDKKHFKDMRKKADDLDELATRKWGESGGETWMELIQDEFMGLYKADPELRKQQEMKATHRINHTVIKKASEQRDFKELRTYTALDEWVSAMAAVNFGRRLEQLFEEEKELQEAQKGMNEANQNVQDIIDEMEQLASEGGDTSELVDKLEEALNEYGDASDGVDDQIKQHQSAIRQAGKQAAKDAKDDTQEAQEAIQAFGTDPGALQRLSPEARMELAARIHRNRKLKDMANKIGRFVRMALGEQARKITHSPEEVYDVEIGDALDRLLPMEQVKLADPDMEDLFYKDFTDKALMQYKLRGAEKVAKGGIICMIDSSGSMGGAKEIWSKAVAIALLNIAAKQKRDFHGILFSSGYDPLMEWEFKGGMAGPMEVLEFAESFIGGGTDFMTPLSRGVDILRQQYNDDKAVKGDIMFITDGISAVTEEWEDRFLNNKEELGFRVYTCVIGTSPGPMSVLSDHIYRISDFAGPGDVREAFGFM